MREKVEIPKGWEWVKLGDVCEKVVGGGTPTTKKSEYWQGDIPWITSADINGLKDIRVRKHISQDAILGSATNLLPKGGIVVVTRVGLGKLALTNCDLCFSQDSQGLIVNKKLIASEYTLWCLSDAVQIFKFNNQGTTISGVTKKQLIDLQIPLPPLPEQHRIVAEIEALFSSLDKGIESLKTAQQQLKVYRLAVLKWAFEGRFTNENVKDGELPDGWRWVKISDAGKVQLGRQRSPKNVSNHYPTKYIRAANITENGLDLSDILEMEFHPKEFSNYQLHHGDIVLSEASGSPTQLGKPAIWKNQIADCCFQNTVIRMRPNELAMSEFLYLLFKFFYNNGYFAKIAGGVGINHLSAGKFSNMEIPLPPTPLIQHAIVSEIESRLSVCDKLEESITYSLKHAEALRQSILKKAFEGKLVPQDPNDEPASVLLERIKAEKEKNMPEKKLKTKKKKQ